MKKFHNAEPSKEVRYLDDPNIEIRMVGEGEDQKKMAVGYAAKFNLESHELRTPDGVFREKIAHGAFDDVLGDDVRALFNHDPNMILARSKNGEGTLSLSVDETGLRYEFEIPDTTAGRDLEVSIRRGDIDQSSFGFVVDRDTWENRSYENGGNYQLRTIHKIKELNDVSPVVYAAYPDATVALRSLQQFQQENRSKETPSKSDPVDDSSDLALEVKAGILLGKPAE